MANAPTLTSHEPRSPATPQPPSEDAGTPRPGAAQTLVSEGQKARSPADHTPRYPPADLPPPPVGKSPKIVRQYELVDLVRAYDPDLDEDLLNRAYVFSMRAHGGQTRQSGDPYFTHPLSVAAILADLKLDPVTIVAALLHDVVEDTGVSVAEIRDLFGDDVALLVDGVTKISEREMSPDADGAAENFAKFILATSKDVRTLMVKLADRLHNMRTLHFIKNPDKQHRIALETMEIYAPLARIIGIDRFREELENLSFYYLLPEEYAGITAALERVAETAVSDVVALSQRLKKAISEAGIEAEIFSREKRAYSVYRKMQRKKVHFEELADIYAFRVIVPNEDDCYRALGVIHRAFRMIPGEFDDYISTPKPNNYRSLHTAVLLSEEQASQAQKAEIQIRTKEMHDAAERGIAAHWRYKAKGGSSVEMGGAENYNAYELLRETVKDLEKGATASELLQQAKIEFYSDQIFTFTPRGRVITLPVGASPLDFAYALHTDIGNDYTGAKVNGRQVPNRTTLKNGDVVEIFRADNAPIPADWQSFVVTGSAKLGLRRRMKAAQAEEQFDFGERILRNVFSAYEVPYSREALRKAARRMGFDTGRALIESVGRLEVRDIAVLDEVYPNLRAALRGPKRPVDSGVTYNRRSLVIDGIDPGATVTLAACCRPLPGERVVGVQGTEDEVTIHRIDCRVLADQAEATWIPVGLKEDPEVTFVSELVLTVTNRAGAIGHIGTLLAKYDANIFDVRVENREAQFSDLRLQITVSDSRHLGHVMTALRGSHFVVAIERANNTEDGR